MSLRQSDLSPKVQTPRAVHSTTRGSYYLGDCVDVLPKLRLDNKAQLIITSPPFPLNRKKAYGNLSGLSYRQWFAGLAKRFSDLLTDDGSIVIELGNAWMPGRPVQSLLHLESLISFAKQADLRLCQQFVCYNPARLPTPAQWVTIERTRLTDSYTHVWWFAKTDNPKANNRKILRPYSAEMKKLLGRKTYNNGNRPSEHRISKTGFLKNHRGSIAHNLIELEPIRPGITPRLPNAMRVGNTTSNSAFLERCRELNIKPHPARMPGELVAFFVSFLTSKGDLVIDPFAGSNTTGCIAEQLGRRWVSVDIVEDYVDQSRIRFELIKSRRSHDSKLSRRNQEDRASRSVRT